MQRNESFATLNNYLLAAGHAVAPIGIVLLLALTTGCASAPNALTPYEPQPIDRYKNVQIKDGLAVAMHPILDGEDSKKHFGSDLPSNNIIPVYVMAENRHPSIRQVLFKSMIVLRIEQLEATQVPHKTAPAPAQTGGPGDAAAILMIYPPVVIVATPFVLASLYSEQKTKPREFNSITLSPGSTTQGFVYFQLPKDMQLPPRWKIHLESYEVPSSKRTQFEFLFTSPRKEHQDR